MTPTSTAVPRAATEASPARRGLPLAWLLLLVGGQGAVLALTQSGKEVTYPHLQFARFMTGPHRLAAVLLAVQLAAVAWGMAPVVRPLWAWLRRTTRPAALLAAVTVVGGLGAVAFREPSVFVAELLSAAVVQLAALGTVVLFVRSLDDARLGTLAAALDRWLGAPLPGRAGDAAGGDLADQPPRFFDRWAVGLAVVVLAVCALLAVVVYERVPHVPDEIVYLWQARYLAEGMLQLPAPPVAAAFDLDLVHYEPSRMFSPLPPGWPAILALGVRAGAPWLVNPLLSALCILLAHALLHRLVDRRTARLATLLLASSPWFLFLGMSLMTHTATLAASLAAALGVAVARARSRAWPAALAGVAVGVVGLIRPLEGLLVALPLGLWSLGARHRRFALLPSAALTVVTVLTASITWFYNRAITGAGGRFPIMEYVDRYYHPGANDMGFGPTRGMGWGGLDPWPGHGLRDVALNTLLNGAATNLELFGWATGSLVLIALLVASRQVQRLDVALLGFVAFVVVLHAFYWFSGGPDFGARYWFLIIVPAALLTARATTRLTAGTSPSAARLTLGTLALVGSAWVTWLPWRSVEKYHRFRHMSGDMRRFVGEHDLGEALVLVRGRRHPDYHQAALENPLDLRAPVGAVFAWDRTAEIRRAAVAAYPNRPVYLIDGPTITGKGYRVVAGPLPPGSLAPEFPSSADIPVVVAGDRGTGAQRRSP